MGVTNNPNMSKPGQAGPLLHARIPGAESEMSVFSKNDEANPTRLPDIGRNTAQA